MLNWTIDWGDGATETVAGNPQRATHIYADGDANFPVYAWANTADASYPASAAASAGGTRRRHRHPARARRTRASATAAG